jgi:hypothetical protein
MKNFIIIFILLSKINIIFCRSNINSISQVITIPPEYFGFFPIVILGVISLIRIQAGYKLRGEARNKTLRDIADIKNLITDLRQKLEGLIDQQEFLLREVDDLVPGNLLTDRLLALDMIGVELKAGQSKVLDYKSQLAELINLVY